MEIISIHEDGKEIELYPGIHNIKIIGSWLVSLNNFEIFLQEINGEKVIKWKEKLLRSNDYVDGKKAKIIGDFDIKKRGKYKIHFVNPSNVELTYMGRFGISLILNKKIPNADLKVAIGN